MNKSRGGHYPRNHLRQRREQFVDQPFSPTVSVERPVIWQDEDAKKGYIRSINKALGKGLHARQRHHHHIVSPDNLRVVQLRHAILSDRSRELHRYDEREAAMERLASILQGRLLDLLQSVPSQLPVTLGGLSRFTETELIPRKKTLREKQLVGVQLEGWRGRKAKYPVNGHEEGIAALRQLASESTVYCEAIEDTNPWFTPHEMIADPFVGVIEKAEPIRRDDFQRIDFSLQNEDAVPRSAILGDPIVCLHTGFRPDQIIEYPVRSLGQNNPLAA